MLRFGLDWSGDGGLPSKRGSSALLVTALVAIDDRDLGAICTRFDDVRRLHRLPPDYVFKYSGTRPSIRASFFDALCGISFRSWILVDDKWLWEAPVTRKQSGWQRVLEEIVTLVCLCSETSLEDAVLMIDLPAVEMKLVNEVRNEVRRVLRTEMRRSFRKVKPCPDHRNDGLVVQIADMLAGAVSDDPPGINAPLRSLGTRVMIRSSEQKPHR